ncbi:MAG: hypothetical protein QOG71_2521 [Pyrinomonadaceae bacterium]|nr:hypothetical protein [Pyrinomonadaceae bacterium]
MLLRVLLFALLIAACLGGGSRLSARGQTAQKYPDNVQRNKTTGDASDDPEQESPHREMLKEMALKREENEYKEHLSRARENARLAVELQEAFARQKTFDGSDIKKLGRMEKLSRQIRSNAGGEENKDELKEPPPQVEVALERLVKLSAELQKKVESTPRQVVSAAIIKRANEVVELVKHIRTLYR